MSASQGRLAMEGRLLTAADESAVRSLLESHADSSMMLRESLRAGSLTLATWAGAFDRGDLCGVAAQLKSGYLVIQAPRGAAEAALAAASRPLGGMLGPWEQVEIARAALGLSQAATRVQEREILFALDLAQLKAPKALLEGTVRVREAKAEDIAAVVDMRLDYTRELDLEPVDSALEEKLRRTYSSASLYVAEIGSEIVAMSSFNARLPSMVQVAGVYTPSTLRSRGYAQCAVAGHLLAARAEGVQRATLFTRATNHSAQAAYRKLGFVPIGDYALIVFTPPQRPTPG